MSKTIKHISDYYKDGETMQFNGVFQSYSGKDGRVDFFIVPQKKIHAGTTMTSNLNWSWIGYPDGSRWNPTSGSTAAFSGISRNSDGVISIILMASKIQTETGNAPKPLTVVSALINGTITFHI